MKKILLLIIVTFFYLSDLKPQSVPNGGFETWTNGSPNSWITSNAPPIIITISQSSTAHSGSYSTRGDVISYLGNTLGPLIQSGSTGLGVPISQRYAVASGWYQLNAVSGDQLEAIVLLEKSRSIVASGTAMLPAASTWTAFNINLFYITSDIPDTAVLQFTLIGSDNTPTVHVGTYFLLDDVNLSGIATSVSDPGLVPAQFSLEQNYPNPFNPSTKIKFSLPEKSFVSLKLYNVIGKEVAVIAEGEFSEGTHEVNFDASNLYSGVYFYTLKAGTNFTQSRKMIVLK